MVTFSLVGVLSIIHLISLCVSALSAFILVQAYRKQSSLLVKSFIWFFVFVFIWMLIFFLTILFTTGKLTASKGWELATSHGFFLIGLAFFARIFAHFTVPKKEKTIFLLSLLLAIGVTIYGLLLRGQYLGVIAVPKANLILSQVSAVLTGLIVIPSALLFLYHGVASKDRLTKVRGLLIGLGMSLLLWHALSLILIPTRGVFPWLIGEALNVVAFTIMLAGILYHPLDKTSETPVS